MCVQATFELEVPYHTNLKYYYHIWTGARLRTVGSPCPKVNSKKNDPRSFFAVPGPPCSDKCRVESTYFDMDGILVF